MSLLGERGLVSAGLAAKAEVEPLSPLLPAVGLSAGVAVLPEGLGLISAGVEIGIDPPAGAPPLIELPILPPAVFPPVVSLNLAHIARESGDLDGCREHLREALRQRPGDEPTQAALRALGN